MVILMQLSTINVVVTIFVVLMVSLVGNMDKQDKEKELFVYCENVKSGVWPDFDLKYSSKCKMP